ncbi:hypothetical protein VTK73DRAFT_1536 [Phialemonium thermophilum]|uniref:Uncharacterized protein n=1 Tax=Phialemonium thermophilum TaxID=223376 RepID=A0ABR3VTB7_9PEZI
MREIARIRGVITALVENGLRVDEAMVMKGYSEACELALHSGDGPEDVYLGGERGEQLVAALTGTRKGIVGVFVIEPAAFLIDSA